MEIKELSDFLDECKLEHKNKKKYADTLVKKKY